MDIGWKTWRKSRSGDEDEPLSSAVDYCVVTYLHSRPADGGTSSVLTGSQAGATRAVNAQARALDVALCRSRIERSSTFTAV